MSDLAGVNEPILIMAMPRSGSSMVAGIFAKHGVWTGTTWPGDQNNAKGHFENVPIRNVLKEMYGPIPMTGDPAGGIEGWWEWALQLIRHDGYDDGPWLFKGNVLYWPIWDQSGFSPRWITVHRSLDAILASGRATGFFRDPDPKAVKSQVDALRFLRENRDAVEVDSDAVIAGDYSTLERALASAGIEMDEGIVSEFVNPELWRFG